VRVWLITVGEPLPLDGATDRLLRTGLLANSLRDRGHEVLWWTSTLDHFRKTRFVNGEPRVVTKNGAALQFLEGTPYKRNISLDRLRNHVQVGRSFARLAAREPRPDIILCSFPTIELAREAVRYGAAAGVPVVLDVRDLWPDIFVDVAPRWLRGVARLLLKRAFDDTAAAFADCAAVIAVSESYCVWGLDKGARSRTADDGVYPLAYQLSDWSPADEKSLDRRMRSAGLDPRGLLVSFVGTFGRTYDLDTVIGAALLRIERGSPPAQFVFCGAGEREANWRRLAAGVPGTGFLGWLPAAELACLLRRSSIGLAAYAPSAPQGIPNKVIEFLAASVPVLCSLAGESRQLLEAGGCGEYYVPGDSTSLADRIDAWVADPSRRAVMAAAAGRLFAERFSAASVYGELADQLESLAARWKAGTK
jgi:glycosyltransferase involved in cell wall biosynthesis